MDNFKYVAPSPLKVAVVLFVILEISLTLRIFSGSIDSETESWSNLSQSEPVLCDGLTNWLKNWVTRNNANFFQVNLTQNWVMFEFESIWLSFSESNWLFFLNESKWLAYMGQYWKNVTQVFSHVDSEKILSALLSALYHAGSLCSLFEQFVAKIFPNF